jgi:hypothetical protein
MISLVPLALKPPVASRHSPEATLSSEPSARGVHFCPGLPLQVHSTAAVLIAVPRASRHLPSERSVPSSDDGVHCWFVAPLQV